MTIHMKTFPIEIGLKPNGWDELKPEKRRIQGKGIIIDNLATLDFNLDSNLDDADLVNFKKEQFRHLSSVFAEESVEFTLIFSGHAINYPFNEIMDEILRRVTIFDANGRQQKAIQALENLFKLGLGAKEEYWKLNPINRVIESKHPLAIRTICNDVTSKVFISDPNHNDMFNDTPSVPRSLIAVLFDSEIMLKRELIKLPTLAALRKALTTETSSLLYNSTLAELAQIYNKKNVAACLKKISEMLNKSKADDQSPIPEEIYNALYVPPPPIKKNDDLPKQQSSPDTQSSPPDLSPILKKVVRVIDNPSSPIKKPSDLSYDVSSTLEELFYLQNGSSLKPVIDQVTTYLHKACANQTFLNHEGIQAISEEVVKKLFSNIDPEKKKEIDHATHSMVREVAKMTGMQLSLDEKLKNIKDILVQYLTKLLPKLKKPLSPEVQQIKSIVNHPKTQAVLDIIRQHNVAQGQQANKSKKSVAREQKKSNKKAHHFL